MKRFLSTVGLAVAGWMSGAGSMSAAEVRARDIPIPFEFKVDKITLPAGRYRLEQNVGKSVVFLMNIETGHGVQMLRDGVNDPTGNTKLTFEKTGQGYKLSKVS